MNGGSRYRSVIPSVLKIDSIERLFRDAGEDVLWLPVGARWVL